MIAHGVAREGATRKLSAMREAVSRWKTGEVELGIDMGKLICVVLDVPACGDFELRVWPRTIIRNRTMRLGLCPA